MAFWIERKLSEMEIVRCLRTHMWTCSACGDDQGYGVTPFCMFCGAKMEPVAKRRAGGEYVPVEERKW